MIMANQPKCFGLASYRWAAATAAVLAASAGQ
jgi:hypothetical protein